MANTVINTPELLNLDSTTGATILAKGTVADRPEMPTFSLDYLIVAGGSGGVYSTSPGGGAGGLRTSYGSTSGGGEGAEPSLNVVSGTSFTVTVGAGGPKINASNYSSPSRGGNSVFGTITSLGGGVAVAGNDSDGIPWKNGGSGTGGSYNGQPGGQGTAGQGFRGGSINGAPNYKAGGSGGAGGVGLDATGSAYSGSSGNGGPGLAVNILNATNAATASVGEVSGSDVYYAGGGGGGSDSYRNRPAGSGGLGGGGNGGYYSNGANGTANTGGGGGAGANRPNTMEGGDGGSGVIILRYPNSVSATVNGATQASGSPFTEGNDKITVLTSGTGTITFTDPTPTNPDEYPINGTLRFNTETNKTEYYDGTGWYEIVDEYASGFIGPATNYFDTKLYTGNGAALSIGGYINGSASFNGSSSSFQAGNGISSQGTDLTFSLWFKTNNNNATQMLVDFNYTAGSGIQIYNGNVSSAGQLIFRVQTGGTKYFQIVSASVISNNTWHNVVGTWQNQASGVAKLYLDGNNINTATSTQTGVLTLGSGNQHLGSRNIGVSALNGEIDQVRIYDTALSSSDVTALYSETAATATTAAFPSGQTAIATYTMDTSANGLLNTQDLSTVNYPVGAGCLALYEMNGNSNDTSGTYNGTPTNITYQGGAFGQAAVFNGSSSEIEVSSNVLNINTISVSAWINLGTTSGFQQIVSNYAADNKGWGLRINDGGYLSYNTAVNVITSSTALLANTWHHVALTIDSSGNSTKLYINGSEDSSTTYTAPTYGASNTNFHIGSLGNLNTQYFNGSIDQVRIFNTALTQSQVTTLARGIATSYSGAATNVNFNGHLNFAPDLVWIKSRDNTQSHRLYDSVRGANLQLSSNQTAVEGNSGGLTSFDANGFSLDNWASVNTNNYDYVAWVWRGGKDAVSNTDGSITSQVSANPDAGFSVVKYTGNNTDGATVGTGLTEACNIVIVKDLTSANYWCVGGSTVGNGENLYLNDTGQKQTRDRVKSVQTNTFTLGSHFEVNSSNNFIAYCFHSVTGYSKMGTYTGNGSSTGPNVTLGFTPSFLMVKRTDSGDNWLVFDNKRNTTNPTNLALVPNSSAAESVGNLGNGFNFLSNGFQVVSTDTGINANGGEYIYMAFA